MKVSFVADSRRSILLSLGILAIITAIVVLPFGLRTEAGGKLSGKGLFTRTVSQVDDLPNYDIRSDKGAFEKMASFRRSLNKDAVSVADVRDSFVAAESKLKSKVPTLKVDYNPEIRTPEVIASDAKLGRALLSQATGEKRSNALVGFLKENKGLIGATEEQLDGLKLFSDYKNPDGNLSFVEYDQEINGIPVFSGEVKAAFTKKGEIIRVINNFAPGLDYNSLSTNFNEPANAVTAAAGSINYEIKPGELSQNASRSNELKTVFGDGDFSITAEKMYFPTEPGIAVPAWRVLIWQPARSFYVIVDAEGGAMLWRKNITEDQTQSANYQVYTNSNAMINVADSPAPNPPTLTDPAFGTQGLPIPRTNLARIGNEAPYTFNNNGWITDGQNTTDGNAVESGLDLAAPNEVDAGSQAVGNPFRTFTSLWNPPPGIPDPGDSPTTDEARRGAVIQQFYIMNWYHDELYRLGFTESARNFQTNNFGRGGVANDRISAEGQDVFGVNNANFSTGADGVRGKMQMFVFTGPTPDRDGSADAEIMIHEATHGTSNRLHGNAGGLSSNMSRAMGEGWSDFYAHCLLSEPGDPILGTYPLTGYVLLQGFGAVGTQNYYYGIRRFPKAVMAATGGPTNQPYNPLTFADIDQLQLNTTNGAFPAMSGPHISTNADQVHAAGEVWSSALWEVRARFVQRLGWAVGNRKTLQLVTDAMKISPLNPTFLQARDAIIAAAIGSAATSTQLVDASDVWAGFAIRGMGFGASIQNQGTGTGNARVTEAFDRPNLVQLPNFTISDAQGDNDGVFEPGETLSLSVPLTNIFGQAALNTTADIPGAGAAVYGTIADGSTTTRQFNYTVPANTACGGLITLTMNVNSGLGAKSFSLPIAVGLKSITLQENFDSVGAPNLPGGWTAAVEASGINFVTSSGSSDTAPNSAFSSNSNFAGGASITSPSITVNSAASTVSFRHNYNTEPTWDGGVLEISIGAGAFQDVIDAGGSFTANGYNGTLGNGTSNPVANRPAWSGNSGGYVTTTVQLPPAANGQNIRLRWRLGTDTSLGTDAGYVGWNVDSITVRATSSCSFAPGTVRSRADFDGDGKSDLSVFRPSEGNWYLKPSLGGITVITWGVSGDEPVPADYDGDGKTDLAIFRPTPGDTADFYIIQSNGFVFNTFSWGDPGDKPVVGDYDGDGKDDAAVYRSSDNNWYIRKSTGGYDVINFGQAGDVVVPGKYDADNKTDRAVYRGSGLWIIANSSGGTTTANWGEATDRPVPADYDGDNRDDIAVWRPANGFWYIRRSTNFQFDIISWGQTGDIPVPGDYDGDGKDDPCIYRNGIWFLNQSSFGYGSSGWGVSTDIPIPAKYIP